MTSVGALAGDGSGLHLDRPCTVLEAAAMANSLILNLYDWQDAGSLGLLWRADNGRGNVLYLLAPSTPTGTISTPSTSSCGTSF